MKIFIETLHIMAELCMEGRENIFSTEEIARKLGIQKYRVRRSLKSASKDDFSLIWENGDDKWSIDPRYVRLVKICKNKE